MLASHSPPNWQQAPLRCQRAPVRTPLAGVLVSGAAVAASIVDAQAIDRVAIPWPFSATVR